MPDLRTVVLDLCRRAGLDENRVDDSGLSGLFQGLVISDRTSARSTLETLLRVYFIDPVESDGKIKFRPRGQPVVATIGEDDLVPISSGDSGTAVLSIERTQEAELPCQVDVVYISRSNDWQSATQTARRQVTSSVQALTITVAMALSDDEAKRIADALLNEAWATRDKFTFQLPRDWSWLEPADVINLTVRGVSRNLHITKTESTTLTVKCTAVVNDPVAVTWNSTGGTPGGVTRVLRTLADTVLMLLDLPPLVDQHADAGFYAFASYVQAANKRWPGAMLYASADGVSYGGVADLGGPGTWGVCSTILVDGTTVTWDEGNSVTVVLRNGELESATAAAVLNGANLALIGDELVQFRDAEVLDTNAYRLSGLLRGRKGTEWATASHGADEAFVLLTAGDLIRVAANHSLIGAERQYRGATRGQAITDAQTITFTARGMALKPLSPCHVNGRRSEAGDWTISWVRRARIDSEWRDGVDVPLDEPAEAYEVEILDDAVVKRTIATGTPSAIYTAAEQVADFGTEQATLAVRVYQISAAVGRGTPKEALL